MFIKEKLYSLDDVTIVPEPLSVVKHRGGISLSSDFDSSRIPVFVSPMDCIVSEKNFSLFEDAGLIPILPRTVSFSKRIQFSITGKWAAFGLDEFKEIVFALRNIYNTELFSENSEEFLGISSIDDIKTFNVCIDMANGHMKSLLDAIDIFNDVRSLIERTAKVNLMVGNIATPRALGGLEERKVDYVRLAVGCGTCCTTTTTTGVNYPMASLVNECYKVKQFNNYNIKLIADGGIKDASYAAKAYALGADYVMVGTTIGCVYEAASELHVSATDKNAGGLFDDCGMCSESEKIKHISDLPLARFVWGMSTKIAQRNISVASGIDNTATKMKQEEGINRFVKVTCTLQQWVERFKFSLRSAMSYCNALNMNEFVGKPTVMILTESSRTTIKDK